MVKLATIRTSDGTRVVRLDGEQATVLEVSDLQELLLRPDWREHAGSVQGETLPAGTLDLAPVVQRPGKIVCVGANYKEHIREMGSETPRYPTLFAKYSEVLIGANDPIEFPPEEEELDWEGELAVIIGRSGRRISRDQAADHIAGFTVANDISMRQYQFRTMQWLQGKTWENSMPLGPVMVTPEELAPSAAITTKVNGVVRQQSTIDDLLFGVEELIEYISTIVTLNPGDVILTGTPSGVGAGHQPPEYLVAGDSVETEIDGIGTLRNVVGARQLVVS